MLESSAQRSDEMPTLREQVFAFIESCDVVIKSPRKSDQPDSATYSLAQTLLDQAKRERPDDPTLQSITLDPPLPGWPGLRAVFNASHEPTRGLNTPLLRRIIPPLVSDEDFMPFTDENDKIFCAPEAGTQWVRDRAAQGRCPGRPFAVS
jgi:hypothetical protein